MHAMAFDATTDITLRRQVPGGHFMPQGGRTNQLKRIVLRSSVWQAGQQPTSERFKLSGAAAFVAPVHAKFPGSTCLPTCLSWCNPEAITII